ncbi:hypothetical protein [Streptomyces griseiscabiei]|uniref:Transposase n=1 Tax=Streptomyces griseiscabiei TaxID=2993540 RepID=A0ABU4L5E2_9ACTN|nr:hypothetical protein [Streptomyces griseiscabiei]MBZ3905242.1 hypothetical protein [Streptomyces griseiscabiei]MDX2910328.1 hypothetical protein [Streptomyces griseiscabiei]
MKASSETSETWEISPTERIRILADILSGTLTARDAARRHALPVRVVQRWLREIPVASPTPGAGRADDLSAPAPAPAPARGGRRPLPRCRVVVDEMVQGLGL